MSTGSLQVCVLSPLLLTLQTQDCTASFNTNHSIKMVMIRQLWDSSATMTDLHRGRWWGGSQLGASTKTRLLMWTASSLVCSLRMTWPLLLPTLLWTKRINSSFRRLKTAKLPATPLTAFYRGTILVRPLQSRTTPTQRDSKDSSRIICVLLLFLLQIC